MRVQQLNVYLNSIEDIVNVISMLKECYIRVCSFYVAESMGNNILRLIVAEPVKALHLLRDNGLNVGMTSVILVSVPRSTEVLNEAMRLLSNRDIAPEYLYVYVDKNDNAVIVYKVNDYDTASGIFKDSDIKVLSAEEVYKI